MLCCDACVALERAPRSEEEWRSKERDELEIACLRTGFWFGAIIVLTELQTVRYNRIRIGAVRQDFFEIGTSLVPSTVF